MIDILYILAYETKNLATLLYNISNSFHAHFIFFTIFWTLDEFILFYLGFL